MKNIIKFACTLALVGATAIFAQAKDEKAAGETKDIKGEIVDINCYADHGAMGEKHAACAQKCINSGLPVGLKAEDGKVYTVVGDHKPMNKELASSAGKMVTLRGKVAEKDGINLLENAELVK